MLMTRLATREVSTNARITVDSTEWRDFESMIDSERLPVDVHSLYGLLSGCIYHDDDREYAYVEDILYEIGFYLRADEVDVYLYNQALDYYFTGTNYRTETFFI